jgi:hypothetical protein
MPLNLTKIAFGAESAAHLAERLDGYAVQGEARLTTRYLPKRHEEMVGGSLYWIVKHMLIGRSPLIGFMDNGAGRIWIRIQPVLIPIQSTPRRAHQGWRYLEQADAPRDLAHGEVDNRDQMPSKLLGDLMRMGLV